MPTRRERILLAYVEFLEKARSKESPPPPIAVEHEQDGPAAGEW